MSRRTRSWPGTLLGLRGGANLPPGPAGTPFVATGGGATPGAGRPTVAIATYTDYAAAQETVDHLSDNGFPVEHTAIVGTNLTLVENVLGRLTTGRAALAGAASGAWFGLFIGLLFAIFSVVNGWWVVIVAVIIGAIWGAIFGAIAHGMTGGRRDFSSSSSLRAGEYAVVVDAEVADQARQLLARLAWQPGQASQPGQINQPGQSGGQPQTNQPGQASQPPQTNQPGRTPGQGG